MPSKIIDKDTPINIVGAGVFGLSTALHLARRGYRNVTIFDKQPYEKTLYSYLNGCDAASADFNKIIRAAYGPQTEYQQLTLEAISEWNAWNSELASSKSVPPGMNSTDRVFVNCGELSLLDADELPAFELATISGMDAAGHKDTQFSTTDPSHLAMAEKKGFGFAMDPFKRVDRGKKNVGVLDSTGGMAVADKACRFALHKARTLGVHTVLDPVRGALESLCYDESGKTVTGIKTRDGIVHQAALTVLACGGWTPSILPELDGLCETTAGSVVHFRIPRESPLFERFAPQNFPTWAYNMREGAEGGLYGFPRDENGVLKIGYRGTKYTNPRVQHDGAERSVPVTRWSTSPGQSQENLKAIPQQALKVITKFLNEFIPELKAEGIDIFLTRVCWYTDSFDNHFVIDRVPEREGLMVATGGSGHAFKFLPVIGNYVVDRIEGVGPDRPALKAWKWRQLQKDQKPLNVLMEGSQGSRALEKVPLVPDSELELNPKARL
ncbi:FAD dependent oxidoreductase [Rhizodiscina lignyota]|uniref:FAD dependent oxidoreductase n=1 Tax=Rhizodiscina lignyota TaxID=1504668 RepID=A0A9P4M6Q3_9PEZI|nr:FAD dependent oxidoreductase [Rhizodiscina lignyota]